MKKTKSSDEEAEKLPYVHVRARRGQATDNHSLAERVKYNTNYYTSLKRRRFNI